TRVGAATTGGWARAARTRDRCLACSAPRVGRSPSRLPCDLAERERARISAIVCTSFICLAAIPDVAWFVPPSAQIPEYGCRNIAARCEIQGTLRARMQDVWTCPSA